jgi:putative hydrolase of the HAD superfamily
MNKNITTLFIDLDGTVYARNNGMLEEMTARIHRYMYKVVGIPKEEVIPTGEYYYQRFGSSLQGLQLFHDIDAEDYLAYVHDLPLQDYLQPDPALRQALSALPHKKWIFTNSDCNHSLRILRLLGIEDLFEGILDVWAMDYVPKPQRWVYKKALKYAGNPDPHQCLFVDDTLKNLKTAHEMGWNTVWMNTGVEHPDCVNFSIPSLHFLPEILIPQKERLLAFQTEFAFSR